MSSYLYRNKRKMAVKILERDVTVCEGYEKTATLIHQSFIVVESQYIDSESPREFRGTVGLRHAALPLPRKWAKLTQQRVDSGYETEVA